MRRKITILLACLIVAFSVFTVIVGYKKICANDWAAKCNLIIK